MSHRTVRIAFLAIVALVVGRPAGAEVAAEVDTAGNFLRTVVLATSSAKHVRIWAKVTSRPNLYALNVDGDLNGDLWPLVADPAQGGSGPWVFWSRFTGTGFDLAWSRFDAAARAWTPIAWIEPAGTPGDDLDPAVAFDSTGRPFLAFWRDEEGVGQVWLSIFLQTRWMPVFRVSDVGVDSVAPTITVLSDSRVRIDYTTATGTVSRTIEFHRPTTITDDATPFGRVQDPSTTTLSLK